MAQVTESVARLIEEFNKLPGVGKKSAERMAYHVLRVHKNEALALADVVSPECGVCLDAYHIHMEEFDIFEIIKD